MNIFSQIGIIMRDWSGGKERYPYCGICQSEAGSGEDKMRAIKDAILATFTPHPDDECSTILRLIPLPFATGEGCNQRIAMVLP